MTRAAPEPAFPDYARAIELLRAADRPVLTTHVQPDGDGIGSEVALALHLRGLGKKAEILNPHPTARRFSFLEPDPPIVAYEPAAAERLLGGTDLLVVLDIAVPNRLGRLDEHVRRLSPPTLIIDHHAGPATIRGFDLRDSGAAATGVMVFEMLERWGATFTPDIATALYVAIAYDTGGFRYSNTRERTHEIAAELIRRGARATDANRHLFESWSLPRVRLLARALERFRLSPRGRVASVVLPLTELEEVGAAPDDLDGIVETLRAIEGVEVAILLKEIGPEATKVSLRSSGPYDVAGFAGRFGGGGHRNAAGAFITSPVADVAERLIPQAHAAFDDGVRPDGGLKGSS
ncbi:MAG TPA: bifunctional oligoribonuclease/PAP phosphatase NrnA [Gemmatimonadota bacterium]|nr:bifunctional oligoribonuclease/PAP phosphatase NrnA [Gemmatimonadota bacterium]